MNDARTLVGSRAIPEPGTETRGLHEPVVYFVRIGDLVKIGTTTNLRKRLSTIGAGYLDDGNALLCLKGGRELERRMHREFADIRIKRELFRDDWLLAEFIRAATEKPLDSALKYIGDMRAALARGSRKSISEKIADSKRINEANYQRVVAERIRLRTEKEAACKKARDSRFHGGR